jgi:hypothetical protein
LGVFGVSETGPEVGSTLSSEVASNNTVSSARQEENLRVSTTKHQQHKPFLVINVGLFIAANPNHENQAKKRAKNSEPERKVTLVLTTQVPIHNTRLVVYYSEHSLSFSWLALCSLTFSHVISSSLVFA